MNYHDEALLNEYKGNLFEYLVAHNIAKKINNEARFLNNLGSDFFNMLKIQEQYIREYTPDLLNKLQSLAQETSNKILKRFKSGEIESVVLVGKAAASGNDGEADLILILLSNESIQISLKLNKCSSFVNTKSGGIKSFISKYFQVENTLEIQNRFNEFFEKEYAKMAIEMNLSVDIEAHENFKNWTNNGFPELPGELSDEQKTILHKFYTVVMNELFRIFQIISKDLSSFNQAMFSLMGNTNKDIIQALCFHQDHNLESVKIHEFEKLDNVSLGELNPTGTNFEILVNESRLQIRLKPMNKFTNTAFKINCSVKY